MSDIDHGAEARRILAQANAEMRSSDVVTVMPVVMAALVAGQVHAMLAAVDVLHEIAHAVGVVRTPRAEQTCEGGC